MEVHFEQHLSKTPDMWIVRLVTATLGWTPEKWKTIGFVYTDITVYKGAIITRLQEDFSSFCA